MKMEKQIHELRLEIAKNLTVDQVIEITEAQVRAEQERDEFRKALEDVREITINNFDHDLYRICNEALK